MTATTPETRTSLILRLGLLAATVCTIACDSEAYVEPDIACLPEEGCDGIAEVQETDVAAAASEDPLLAAPRRTHASQSPTRSFTIAPGTVENSSSVPELGLTANTCERDDPRLSYAADDLETCAQISIFCKPGWTLFTNGCGCGCESMGTSIQDFSPL